MNRSWALLLCACALDPGAALAARPGNPAPLKAELASLPQVPRHALARAAVDEAIRKADRPVRPARYAVPVAVDATLAAGRWSIRDASTRSWRLRIASAGARSLSARLHPLVLPAGAELWLYAPDGSAAHGPFTRDDVAPSGLWTPIVPGDEMVVEVRAPAARAGEVQLKVAEAYHAFAEPKAGGPNASGACNIDSACESAQWGAEARSVALITIGNQFFCSGQLLNNVDQDRRALFLTARHCGIERERGSAASASFYFNYASPCGQAAGPLPDATVTGATLLADDETADFALLLLRGSLPADVYYAGWNATGDGANGGASLHHPSGDARKISLFETELAPATVDIGGACNVEAWEVHWVRGTTEGGSSGGGLWSADRQVIGILSGGTASCENPNGADFYGRLGVAWTARPEPDGQLKAHLDPDGTCIAAVAGLDPQVVLAPGPVTSGPLRCEGPTAVCTTPRMNSGGAAAPMLLVLLLGAGLLRRRT